MSDITKILSDQSLLKQFDSARQAVKVENTMQQANMDVLLNNGLVMACGGMAGYNHYCLTDAGKAVVDKAMRGAWQIIEGDCRAAQFQRPRDFVKIERKTQHGLYQLIQSDGYPTLFYFKVDHANRKQKTGRLFEGVASINGINDILVNLKDWARLDFAKQAGIDPADVIGWE